MIQGQTGRGNTWDAPAVCIVPESHGLPHPEHDRSRGGEHRRAQQGAASGSTGGQGAEGTPHPVRKAGFVIGIGHQSVEVGPRQGLPDQRSERDHRQGQGDHTEVRGHSEQ
eukprot:1553061-Heterocapsa_arctica.AAC.1